MAKRYDPMSGMSINDILNINPEKLMQITDRKELRQMVSRLASAANKRLKRAEKAGRVSYAVSRTKAEGKFSVAGKSVAELKQEYQRAKMFLQDKTTTAKGYKKSAQTVVGKLQELGYQVTEDEAGKMLKLYTELRAKDSNIRNREERYKYLDELNEIMNDTDMSHDLISSTLDDIESMLSGFDRGGVNDGSNSGFFEI